MSFKIETYKVRLEIQRIGNPVETRRARIIELQSAVLYHGIVESAMLHFSTYWDNFQAPFVGYFDTTNQLQPRLTCWLPSTEYSFWYDVLRAESPLWLFYDITPIGGANYVSKVMLGSSTEPVGEGPKDMSAEDFVRISVPTQEPIPRR